MEEEKELPEDLSAFPPEEEEEEPAELKPKGRETTSKNIGKEYGEKEVRKILIDAIRLKLINDKGEILLNPDGSPKLTLRNGSAVDVVLPSEKDTYGGLYNSNKIPIVITKKYFSIPPDKKQFASLLGLVSTLNKKGKISSISSATLHQYMTSKLYINPRLVINLQTNEKRFMHDGLTPK